MRLRSTSQSVENVLFVKNREKIEFLAKKPKNMAGFTKAGEGAPVSFFWPYQVSGEHLKKISPQKGVGGASKAKICVGGHSKSWMYGVNPLIPPSSYASGFCYCIIVNIEVRATNCKCRGHSHNSTRKLLLRLALRKVHCRHTLWKINNWRRPSTIS